MIRSNIIYKGKAPLKLPKYNTSTVFSVALMSEISENYYVCHYYIPSHNRTLMILGDITGCRWNYGGWCVQITEGGVYAITTLSMKPLAQFYVTKCWILEQLVLTQCIWFI